MRRRKNPRQTGAFRCDVLSGHIIHPYVAAVNKLLHQSRVFRRNVIPTVSRRNKAHRNAKEEEPTRNGARSGVRSIYGHIIHPLINLVNKPFAFPVRFFTGFPQNNAAGRWWARPDLNRRPSPCEGDVITPRPRARTCDRWHFLI
jgi:hypothetical protein